MIELTAFEKEELLKYADFAMFYNKAFNLSASKTSQDFFDNHILDALYAASFFEDYKDKVIYDIGSGVGIPGIALAIHFSKTRFVLVERGNKRAKFLKNAVGYLQLSDRVEVRECDIKNIKNEIEIATFRALGAFDLLEKSIYDSLAKNATLILYKGKLEESIAMACDDSLWDKKIHSYSFQDKSRTIVILNKK